MINFYKDFKKIKRGIENHGYIEWKQKVKEHLMKMDELHLSNYKKRKEICYEQEKRFTRKGNLVDMVSQILGFSLPFLGAILGTYSSWGANLNNIILAIDGDNTEIVQFAVETASTLITTVLRIGGIVLTMMVVYYVICYVMEQFIKENSINKEIYFGELLKIIEEVEKSEEWKTKKEKNSNDKLASDTTV